MKKRLMQRGFSLIELIVVIALIALIATMALSSFDTTRHKAQDTKRTSEIQTVQKALELYYISNQRYPNPDVDGCGWDIGNAVHPLFSNVGMNSYFGGNLPPVDTAKFGPCDGYRYYLYPPGAYGCPAVRGSFYVLGVTDMESTPNPHPDSPGWSCPGRNWKNEFDWVAGSFEN